jgi:hypothetical protein
LVLPLKVDNTFNDQDGIRADAVQSEYQFG